MLCSIQEWNGLISLLWRLLLYNFCSVISSRDHEATIWKAHADGMDKYEHPASGPTLGILLKSGCSPAVAPSRDSSFSLYDCQLIFAVNFLSYQTVGVVHNIRRIKLGTIATCGTNSTLPTGAWWLKMLDCRRYLGNTDRVVSICWLRCKKLHELPRSLGIFQCSIRRSGRWHCIYPLARVGDIPAPRIFGENEKVSQR
ncbi:hypothetical protein CC78DRAFT_267650 [Lojkania enalia]|uniref:Secreted protein n=1 Tax=Lojkania enalia TaxID=147567 RepID=A0A9P4KCN7_9PLEO|nr:hypothetical protein CC78DRAFT_267650 [Didymosphaeria enalia]